MFRVPGGTRMALQFLPFIGLTKTVLDMIPKGNRRRAAADLASVQRQQLSGMASNLADLLQNVSDPFQRFVFQQIATQLLAQADLAGAIIETLTGEDSSASGA